MSRARARADICREIDNLRARADALCDQLQAEEEARCKLNPETHNSRQVEDMLQGVGFSIHSMQQSASSRFESHNDYYERRRKQAQVQADAHPGEVYDDDLDCWRRLTAAEIEYHKALAMGWTPAAAATVIPHIPSMVREFEGWDESADIDPETFDALCGPMGRAA